MRPTFIALTFAALKFATMFSFALGLTGCLPHSDPSQAIPTLLVPASQAPTPAPAQRLVVVLPGRGDDLKALRASGIAESIQSVWPDADVLFAELTLGYYMQGRAPERLHAEVIAPARERGYREVWLVGASMGGMGVLLYDRLHPGELDGLVLLAPYLGDAALLREIGDAGGIARWDAGPPGAVDDSTWQRELWRHVQNVSRDPAQSGRYWLAYGRDDRLRDAIPLLTPALRDGHVMAREGGHTWAVWTPAMADVLRRIDAERRGNGGRPPSR